MLDLALRDKSRPVTLKEVARRQDVSEKYLWQVIAPLKASGLVSAVLGAHGGYALTRPPSKTTLYEILRLLGGPWVLEHTAGVAGAERGDARVTREIWAMLGEELAEVMRSITLQDMARRCKAAREAATPDYSI